MNQVAPLASQSTNSVAEQKLARLDSFTHLLIRDVRSMVDARIVMDAANNPRPHASLRLAARGL